MINSKQIYTDANNMVKKFGTRNAFAIAREIGIEVFSVDYFNSLLGMYVYRWRKRAIFYNNSMDDYLAQMVVAHEIGHDTYHRKLANSVGLKEFELFRMTNTIEYGANVFAAHLLLDTEMLLDFAKNDYDVVQIPTLMGSEINFTLIKLQEMIKLGYSFNLPAEPNRNFFKNVKPNSNL